MAHYKVLTCESKGDFKHTENWLTKKLHLDPESILRKYGEIGVKALADATPVRTGKTASSWNYTYSVDKFVGNSIARASLYFNNSSLTEGRYNIPIVILIEYGHGTRNGGYVPPHPFIQGVTKEVFDDLANALWKEVSE